VSWRIGRRSSETSDTRGSLGRVFFDDLRRTRIQRDYLREIKDLYYFYLDEETRVRLASMPLRIHTSSWAQNLSKRRRAVSSAASWSDLRCS